MSWQPDEAKISPNIDVAEPIRLPAHCISGLHAFSPESPLPGKCTSLSNPLLSACASASVSVSSSASLCLYYFLSPLSPSHCHLITSTSSLPPHLCCFTSAASLPSLNISYLGTSVSSPSLGLEGIRKVS